MKIKGFDKNLCCKGYQFEIGGEYKIENDGKPLKLCSDTVFHYCDSLSKVSRHYPVSDDENRYCEILVLGEEVTDGEKCGSDHIKILREIVGEELRMLKGRINGNTGNFNTGDRNTGDCNTGDRNTGDFNTGDRNVGGWNTGDRNTGGFNTRDRNTGDFNTGSCNTGDFNTGGFNTGSCNTGNFNTGDRNTGNFNTGDHNTGSCNTGDFNTGSCNTGDFNTGDHNTGCFCTERNTLLFFDKESSLTYQQWLDSDAKRILKRINFCPVEWISEEGMTDLEKEENPTYKITGGYLKVRDLTDCYKDWWEELSILEKEVIMNIPNFDPEKFKKITGIEV